MAQHFLSSIYGTGYGAIGTAQGTLVSFPVQGTVFVPAGFNGNSQTTFNGVTALSIIQVLPTGLNQKVQQFFSIDSVSTLNTAANA